MFIIKFHEKSLDAFKQKNEVLAYLRRKIILTALQMTLQDGKSEHRKDIWEAANVSSFHQDEREDEDEENRRNLKYLGGRAVRLAGVGSQQRERIKDGFRFF